jgi:hypothetical protein
MKLVGNPDEKTELWRYVQRYDNICTDLDRKGHLVD